MLVLTLRVLPFHSVGEWKYHFTLWGNGAFVFHKYRHRFYVGINCHYGALSCCSVLGTRGQVWSTVRCFYIGFGFFKDSRSVLQSSTAPNAPMMVLSSSKMSGPKEGNMSASTGRVVPPHVCQLEADVLEANHQHC